MTTTITDSAIIAKYNRGPLTTVFQAPSSCLSTFTLNNGNDESGMYCGHARTNYYDSACYPSSINSGTSDWIQYYYSPGQCPEGWAHATTFTSYFPNTVDVKTGQALLSLGSKTTAVLCCPSGWTSWGGSGHQCATSANSGAKFPFVSTTLSHNQAVVAKAVTTTITSNGYLIWGDGIPVWWQSTDLAAFTAPPKTRTSSATTSTNKGSLPSTTSTNSAPPKSESSGLSTGAKIAIGVTIPIVALLLLLGVFLYFRRHAKRKAQHKPVELETEAQYKVVEPQADESKAPKELPTNHAVSELDGRIPEPQEYHEMPGH